MGTQKAAPHSSSVRNQKLKKGTFTYLSSPKIIICIFLGVYIIGILSFILFGETGKIKYLSYSQILGLKLLSLLTYAIILYFIYKGVRVAQWFMALIIFFSGVHSLMVGFLGSNWNQYLIKTIFMIIGIYFIYGGIVIFRFKDDKIIEDKSVFDQLTSLRQQGYAIIPPTEK